MSSSYRIRHTKAKCPANQEGLNRLALRFDQAKHKAKATATNTDYVGGMIWNRAMKSLAAAKDPITTHKEAMALPNIGPTMANVIMGGPPPRPPMADDPSVASTATTKQTSRKKKTKAATNDLSLSQLSSASSASMSSSKIVGGSSLSLSQSTITSYQETTTAGDNHNDGRKRPRTTTTSTTTAKASDKELAYQKAVSAAENWKSLATNGKFLTWKVVLLIDQRERKSEHVQAKCEMSGIPCEERTLPIGDMAWVAQGLLDTDTSSKKTVVIELLLGTIIERKTPDDLKSSIFGTRYFEQRLRLQHCGLPQIVYLIEGDINTPLFGCTSETLHTAMWETRLHLQFAIVQTAHMADTVMTLKRMHRRLLQRTFPRAFGNTRHQDALPTFAEATMSAEERRRSIEEEHRRRKRRRQSLAEMTFNMDPTPPLGMERFISYQELKAKIELDREAGTKTMGNLHLAMLKQVPTIEAKKCHAVASVYPTMRSLLHAFATDPQPTQYLISEIVTRNPSKSAVNRTIGTNSAQQLRMAYGIHHGSSTGTTTTNESTATRMDSTTITTTRDDAQPPPPTIGIGASLPTASMLAALRATTTTSTVMSTTRLPTSSVVAPAVGDENSIKNSHRRPNTTGTTSQDTGRLTTTGVVKKTPTVDDSNRTKKKRSLNTSIGSLLRSSDDDESPPHGRRNSEHLADNNDSTTFASSSNGARGPQPTTMNNNAVVHLLDSSDDDDDDSYTRRVVKASRTTDTTRRLSNVVTKKPPPKQQHTSRSDDQEVIEID